MKLDFPVFPLGQLPAVHLKCNFWLFLLNNVIFVHAFLQLGDAFVLHLCCNVCVSCGTTVFDDFMLITGWYFTLFECIYRGCFLYQCPFAFTDGPPLETLTPNMKLTVLSLSRLQFSWHTRFRPQPRLQLQVHDTHTKPDHGREWQPLLNIKQHLHKTEQWCI